MFTRDLLLNDILIWTNFTAYQIASDIAISYTVEALYNEHFGTKNFQL